ncbi:sarcoplasmic calcium-binding protein-like [Lingula anatina]|uniref:Sarcoplasmic calcium-binding protein-like n=1 Tax=Lingula anatina TaxID=7574 RepID=A0A1S3HKL3_LINAN|nr:sarcoplasmic calcium-binding protein-like [Lingula anatina]|eukprot:XP_013386638.1 sarcoplasmic calcium-binding protein-like [Lingula anatina]
MVYRTEFVGGTVKTMKQHLKAEKVELLESLLSKAWELFWGGESTCSLDTMIHHYGRCFTEPHFHELLREVGSLFFEAVDADNDGLVTIEEFATYLGCYGVHPLSVPPSFQALDTNHDGLISREEFVNAACEFFTKTCDTPAKLFFGPFLG